MIQCAFFDTKPYDRVWFDKLSDKYGVNFKYYEYKLTEDKADMKKGCIDVCGFVNDKITKNVISIIWIGFGCQYHSYILMAEIIRLRHLDTYLTLIKNKCALFGHISWRLILL